MVACYVVSGEADFLVEAVVPDLGAYEELLLDQMLAIGPVTDARSTFAIRTVLSRGPLPLRHWPPVTGFSSAPASGPSSRNRRSRCRRC